MSWNLMLGGWQLALLLSVPPAILLLYFLKLKRQPLEVPSTYLWHKSIEDLRVNSIWQRLRQNLLLFLQILLILLALLALFRPGWKGTDLAGDRFIFLVDNSASMSATDAQPSRLDEAKRRVGELIDQMRSSDLAMIISFSDSARVEQLFTANRRELHRRLAQIRPSHRTTSLLEALRVAAGLANPGRSFEIRDNRVTEEGQEATLYIFSDGRFPNVQGFALGKLNPVYVPIGSAEGGNVGITAFSTRRSESGDRLQAYARLENSGSKDVTADVQLDVPDGQPDFDRVTIKAKGSAGVAFDLGELREGQLKLTVRPGGALAVDDVAYAAVQAPKRRKVLLVTPGNPPLELALGTKRAREIADVTIAAPALLATKEHQSQAAAGAFDLVIYDGCRPEEMPQANTLFIGSVPKSGGWSAGAKAEGPQILDIETASPLMQLIDLGNVKFAEGTPLRGPPGSRTLIETDVGPLFVIGPRQGLEDAVLGVEIIGVNDKGEKYYNTNWHKLLSFPVFVLGAVEYLSGGRGDPSSAGSVQPGRVVTLRSGTPSQQLSVRAPSGKSTTLARSRLGNFSFGDTDEPGVYDVLEAGRVQQRFAVNLFDSLESNIAPRSGDDQPIRIGHVDVKGQTSWAGGRREIWKPLLWTALAVLLLEWYIYNRRVYI